jgi:hypothetical protein
MFGLGTQIRTPKAYFCHIPGHIFFILFSYFCENLVFRPVHTDNLYKASARGLTRLTRLTGLTGRTGLARLTGLTGLNGLIRLTGPTGVAKSTDVPGSLASAGSLDLWAVFQGDTLGREGY